MTNVPLKRTNCFRYWVLFSKFKRQFDHKMMVIPILEVLELSPCNLISLRVASPPAWILYVVLRPIFRRLDTIHYIL